MPKLAPPNKAARVAPDVPKAAVSVRKAMSIPAQGTTCASYRAIAAAVATSISDPCEAQGSQGARKLFLEELSGYFEECRPRHLVEYWRGTHEGFTPRGSGV